MVNNFESDAKKYRVTQDRKKLEEIQNRIATVLSRSDIEIEVLACEMIHEFQRVQQQPEEFNRKLDFVKNLKEVIQKNNPKWKFDVIPTGSSVSGLATANSDIDLAIYIPQAARVLDKECAGRSIASDEKQVMLRRRQIEILQIIRIILKNDENIKNRIDWSKEIKLVQAQIPILQVETVDRIECDISVVMDSFLSSMHNSFLIKQLTFCDIRFAPLCFTVKKWADSTGVKNPKEGGFNSYALVLLVIHFLQCGTSPPILPNLMKLYERDNFIAQSEENFPKKLDFGSTPRRRLPVISKNNAQLGQLFLEFLCYYSEFDFAGCNISVKDGCVKNRNSIMSSSAAKDSSKSVFIEDPFDSHNPGRTVRSAEKMKHIFRETIKKFHPESNSSEDKIPTLNDILNMKMSDGNEENEEDNEDNGEDYEYQD